VLRGIQGRADKFEGKVAPSGAEMTVEGTWQFTGGDGTFKGLTGKGTFKIRLSSPKQWRVPGRVRMSLHGQSPRSLIFAVRILF